MTPQPSSDLHQYNLADNRNCFLGLLQFSRSNIQFSLTVPSANQTMKFLSGTILQAILLPLAKVGDVTFQVPTWRTKEGRTPRQVVNPSCGLGRFLGPSRSRSLETHSSVESKRLSCSFLNSRYAWIPTVLAWSTI